jgi:hypothetical protein
MKRTLKPVFHSIGSRVETGWFQAMGQLDSTCTAPPWCAASPRSTRARVVAVQVYKLNVKAKFENRNITSQVQGLQPGAFELWVVNWSQLVQPHLVRV